MRYNFAAMRPPWQKGLLCGCFLQSHGYCTCLVHLFIGGHSMACLWTDTTVNMEGEFPSCAPLLKNHVVSVLAMLI